VHQTDRDRLTHFTVKCRSTEKQDKNYTSKEFRMLLGPDLVTMPNAWLPVNLDWKNLQLYFYKLSFKLSSHSIMNVGSKVIYGLWTTKKLVKFHEIKISLVCIFHEQVSVDFTSLSKGFKTQGS
jgi:hypothetical protein